MKTMILINIQYNKIIIASVDIGFLGVTIFQVTLSCSQYLYSIMSQFLKSTNVDQHKGQNLHFQPNNNLKLGKQSGEDLVQTSIIGNYILHRLYLLVRYITKTPSDDSCSNRPGIKRFKLIKSIILNTVFSSVKISFIKLM